MSKAYSVLLITCAIVYAGQSGSFAKSGQNINADDNCTGYDGVFKCTHTDPSKTCINIEAYIAGANQSGLKNKKPGDQKKCSDVEDQVDGCIGTAVKMNDFSCTEIQTATATGPN